MDNSTSTHFAEVSFPLAFKYALGSGWKLKS